MDKIVGIKRKAQRYVQSGDVTKAVAEYERLVESGEMDPYDFVYLGDLLVKINRPGDAVHRYRDAIQAYERVGLYKNAIAVGKKILRIRPEAFDIHRLVGGLYFLEGLFNDSLFYYMQFLSAAPPESESASIEEVGLRLLGMPLPSPEVALNIVSTMTVANCARQAGLPLYNLALAFEQRGATDWAEPLKQRALELDPNLMENPPVPGYIEAPEEPGSFAPPLVFEPLRPGPERAIDRAPAGGPAESGYVASEHLNDFGMIRLKDDPGDGSQGLDVVEEVASVEGIYEIGSGGDESEIADLALLKDQADAIEALLAEDSDLDRLDFRSMVTRGQEHLAGGDSARGLRVLLAAGRVAFIAGESKVAENVYIEIVKLDPNHLEALQGLTEIAHINGERSKIVRYGCELGDVLLSRESYAEAKLEFERVLQFDPRNEKARARVTRLNSIDGMDQVTARPLAPVASEVKGATVSVRKEPPRTQSILDLSEIMSEFQTAVASQFPAEDAQSHYDLGMTYNEMGMVDQAVSEFEIAVQSPAYRARATEMIARCLISTGRPDEALKMVEEVASVSTDDEPERQASLFACRGLALEALGRAAEALHNLEMALSIDPGLTSAREAISRLRPDGNQAAA